MAHPLETELITAHEPLPLAEKIDQLAVRLERSRSWIIKQALTAWVDQEEEHDRLTLDALIDVDARRLIDHQTVLEWADSLGTDKPLLCHADATEMDKQGTVRLDAAVRILGSAGDRR